MTRLPPGPRWVLPATIRYLRDPYGALLGAGRKYGDPYVWPSAFGRMVITGSPAGAQTVFSADPDTSSASTAARISTPSPNDSSPSASSRGSLDR
jgi:hypothetical protein